MSPPGVASLQRGLRHRRHGPLTRAATWLVVGAVVSRATVIVAIVVASRILDPTAFGRFALVQGATLLAAGMAGLGLSVAMTRQVADTRASDPAAAGRYLGTSLAITGVSALATGAAIFLARGWLSTSVFGDALVVELLPPAAAATTAMALVLAAQAGLTGLEAFRSAAALQVVQAAAGSAGIVAGAAIGATEAMTGFALGQVLAACAAGAMVRRASRGATIRLSRRLAPDERRSLARFALPALGALVVVSAALLAGQLVLSRQEDGFRQVAQFSVAYRWHLAILFLPSAAIPALLPVLTRLRREDSAAAARSVRQTLLWSVALVAVPTLAAVAGASAILGLNGSFYAEDPTPLIVLALAAVPCVVNNVLSSAALSAGRVRQWLVSDVALAGTLVVLAALLIPAHGATGLAWAYLAAYAVSAAVLLPVLATARPAVTAGVQA